MAQLELDNMEYSSDALAQAAYVSDGGVNLVPYSESTIKTQGSYSLKGIATITNSLNKTLTKTLASNSNLSDVKNLKFDIRSSRIGNNIKIGIHNKYDTYTKLLSSFDGADAAVAYTDPIAGAYTFYGTAQLDTAQKNFGTASLLLDGNSDYITLPDSTDWDLWNTNTTIDFWMRMSTVASGVYTIVYQYQDASNAWFIFIRTDLGKIQLRGVMGGVVKYDYQGSFVPLADTWYHIAVVKYGSSFLMFVDGTSIEVTAIAPWSTPSALTGLLYIGAGAGGTNYFFPGWIDELRISKGIVRWTSNFIVPMYPYINTYEITPDILTADTFQRVRWDLSGVADVNKDAIDKIIITIVNADAANTFYLDYIEIAQAIDIFGIVS